MFRTPFLYKTICLLNPTKSQLPRIVSLFRGLYTKSVSETLSEWIHQFDHAGVPEARASAEYIIAHVLKRKTLHDVADETLLDLTQLEIINNLCHLRLKRMPVQYVLGEWDFRELTLKMKPPVLIPRPETEELADLCSETLKSVSFKQDVRFLEIGCGSGALILTLLHRFPQVTGVGVDIASECCELSKENADRVGVSSRLTVIEGDFINEKVLRRLQGLGPFDLVVSNPPYVTQDEMAQLQPEIAWFEDSRALDGGVSGLDLVRKILSIVPDLLLDEGMLWLEVGCQHPVSVCELVSKPPVSAKLSYKKTVKDMFGKDRFCHIQKR